MRCLKEPFQTTHSELSSIKAEPFINVRIMKKKAILSLPAPRVKKIIQTDKNIGKLASQTPFVVSKLTELFIEELVKISSKLATDRGDNKLTAWHLAQVLENEAKFEIVKNKAAVNPQIIAAQEPKKPKKKSEGQEEEPDQP